MITFEIVADRLGSFETLYRAEGELSEAKPVKPSNLSNLSNLK